MSDTKTVGEVAETKKTGKSVKELLAEVKSETPANGKANKGGKKQTKKAAKKEQPEGQETVKTEPQLPGITIDILNPPQGELRQVERKSITRDKRLQHRSKLLDTSEGGAVDQYAEVIREAKKDGKEPPFPPVKIVEDVSDTPDKGTLWLYDGYQRDGAFDLCHLKMIPALVIKGTYADALALSLASNADNSVLPRTKDDARRSVIAAIETPQTKQWVINNSKGEGGVHRTLARLCKCSVGTVDAAFKIAGVKAKGGDIVPHKYAKPKPEPKPDAGTNLTPPANAPEVTPEQQRAADREAIDRARTLEVAKLLATAEKAAKQMGAVVSILLTTEKYATVSRNTMTAAGFPMGEGFDVEMAEQGKEFMPFYSALENWEVCRNLAQMFAKIAHECKAIDTPAPGTEATPEKANLSEVPKVSEPNS